MSNYHTEVLAKADIFTVMGSVYAEVSRYDTAIASGNNDQARQASGRAQEIIEFAQNLRHINQAQKKEIKQFNSAFLKQAKASKASGLDNYLMPFAVAARMRAGA